MNYGLAKCTICGTVFEKKKRDHALCSDKCRNDKIILNRERRNRQVFGIFERDKFSCVYCGKSSIEDGVKLVVDHLVPIIAGGNNSIYNLVTSCNDCNAMKLTRILDRDILLSIIKRNVRLIRGMSAGKRNEIKMLLSERFPFADNDKSILEILRSIGIEI